MRGSGLWRGGSPGRPPGVPNKATAEVRAFCQSLVADPEYRSKLEQRWRSGALAPPLEAMVWAYSVGKPQQSLEVTGDGLSLAQLIAGPFLNDEDDHDRDEPLDSSSDNGQR